MRTLIKILFFIAVPNLALSENLKIIHLRGRVESHFNQFLGDRSVVEEQYLGVYPTKEDLTVTPNSKPVWDRILITLGYIRLSNNLICEIGFGYHSEFIGMMSIFAAPEPSIFAACLPSSASTESELRLQYREAIGKLFENIPPAKLKKLEDVKKSLRARHSADQLAVTVELKERKVEPDFLFFEDSSKSLYDLRHHAFSARAVHNVTVHLSDVFPILDPELTETADVMIWNQLLENPCVRLLEPKRTKLRSFFDGYWPWSSG